MRVTWLSQFDEIRVLGKTARTFSIDTGCPPPELFVTVNIASGMRARPILPINSSRAAIFMLPLNGSTVSGCLASGICKSTASPPTNSTLARVVSKCVLFGTTSPFLHITLNRMRSAARP